LVKLLLLLLLLLYHSGCRDKHKCPQWESILCCLSRTACSQAPDHRHVLRWDNNEFVVTDKHRDYILQTTHRHLTI